MGSEGIILKEPEKIPEDPYSKRRSIKPVLEHVNTSPAKFEKLYRFLHMDSKVNSEQMGRLVQEDRKGTAQITICYN